MKRSENRILTTHTGSLSRAPQIADGPFDAVVILVSDRTRARLGDRAPGKARQVQSYRVGEPLAVATQPAHRALLLRSHFKTGYSAQYVV